MTRNMITINVKFVRNSFQFQTQDQIQFSSETIPLVERFLWKKKPGNNSVNLSQVEIHFTLGSQCANKKKSKELDPVKDQIKDQILLE